MLGDLATSVASSVLGVVLWRTYRDPGRDALARGIDRWFYFALTSI